VNTAIPLTATRFFFSCGPHSLVAASDGFYTTIPSSRDSAIHIRLATAMVQDAHP